MSKLTDNKRDGIIYRENRRRTGISTILFALSMSERREEITADEYLYALELLDNLTKD